MMQDDCPICTKHQDFGTYTGEIIIERGGMILTHFPQLENEKATKGHLLLELRRYITDLANMNESETAAFGGIIRDGVRAMKATLDCEHVYLYRINDKVAHLHFHLIPRYPGTPKEYWGLKIMEYPDAKKIALPEIKILALEIRKSLLLL